MHPANDLRQAECHLSDREERGFRTVPFQRGQHAVSQLGLGAVVERQDDFLVLKKIVDLVMGEAECRAACGVNLHHPADTEGVGIARTILCIGMTGEHPDGYRRQ